MRKAKSKAAKQTKTQARNDGHLSLDMINERRIKDLSVANMMIYHALSGSIRQLMASHNALLESAKGLTVANQRSIAAAAAVLECSVDQKIDHMNEFLDRESESGKHESKPKSRRRKKQTRVEKAESKVRRGRGRPKGSKNRPKPVQKTARKNAKK